MNPYQMIGNRRDAVWSGCIESHVFVFYGAAGAASMTQVHHYVNGQGVVPMRCD